MRAFIWKPLKIQKMMSPYLNRKALLMAHRQSCLFHLVGAYRAFIWEVANTYDESYVATQSLQELLLQARANGKVVTELERVYELSLIHI